MLCADSAADVMVLALIGERGREVREFLEQVLTPEARALPWWWWRPLTGQHWSG